MTSHNCTKLSYLIVDPNPQSVDVVATALKQIGLHYVRAIRQWLPNVDAIFSARPDVILLQFANGSSSAIALVQAIRRHPDAAFREVPIIAYISTPTMGNFLSAKNSGVHEFMAKPFSARDVERRVDHVVNKPRDWIVTANYV